MKREDVNPLFNFTKQIQFTLKIYILIVLVLQSFIFFGQQKNKWLSLDYHTKYSHQSIKINNLSDYSFFLHGEIHTVSSNPETKLEFLKYYYEEANVRNLVIEGGYGSAYLSNLFIETGDESYLCKNIDFAPHHEDREFWRELYQFNKTLKEPIKIVGIDDHERAGAWYKAIEVLFRDKSYQKYSKVNSIVSQIIRYSNNFDLLNANYEILKSIKKEFVLSYKDHQDLYTEILQQDSIHLRLIIQNDVSVERNRYTNKIMFDNLHRLIKANQINDGNFFGQFGSAHVENHNRSLTHYLNDIENSRFYGKVLVVLTEYVNCNVSDLYIEDGRANTVINPIKNKKNKITSFSASTYTLEELKSKKNNPLKYILHIRNKDAMRYDFPKSCN